MVDLDVQPVHVGAVVRQVEPCVVHVDAAEAPQVRARFADGDSGWLTVLEVEDTNLELGSVDAAVREPVVDDFSLPVVELQC